MGQDQSKGDASEAPLKVQEKVERESIFQQIFKSNKDDKKDIQYSVADLNRLAAVGDINRFRDILDQIPITTLGSARGKIDLTLEQTKKVQTLSFPQTFKPTHRWTPLLYGILFENEDIVRQIFTVKGVNLKLLLSLDDDYSGQLDASYGLRLCMRIEQKPFRVLKLMLNEHSYLWTKEELLQSFGEIKNLSQQNKQHVLELILKSKAFSRLFNGLPSLQDQITFTLTLLHDELFKSTHLHGSNQTLNHLRSTLTECLSTSNYAHVYLLALLNFLSPTASILKHQKLIGKVHSVLQIIKCSMAEAQEASPGNEVHTNARVLEQRLSLHRESIKERLEEIRAVSPEDQELQDGIEQVQEVFGRLCGSHDKAEESMKEISQSIVEAIIGGDLFKVINAMQKAYQSAGVFDISQIRMDHSLLTDKELKALTSLSLDKTEINPFMMCLIKGSMSIVTYFCEDQKIDIKANMSTISNQQLLSLCLTLSTQQDQSQIGVFEYLWETFPYLWSACDLKDFLNVCLNSQALKVNDILIDQVIGFLMKSPTTHALYTSLSHPTQHSLLSHLLSDTTSHSDFQVTTFIFTNELCNAPYRITSLLLFLHSHTLKSFNSAFVRASQLATDDELELFCRFHHGCAQQIIRLYGQKHTLQTGGDKIVKQAYQRSNTESTDDDNQEEDEDSMVRERFKVIESDLREFSERLERTEAYKSAQSASNQRGQILDIKIDDKELFNDEDEMAVMLNIDLIKGL